MTPEELEAIRERDRAFRARVPGAPFARPPNGTRAANDRILLLEEVINLRARVEELEHGRLLGCENTPWPGCDCPGCSLAREEAIR